MMADYSEDHIALAAEYALGTLDAEERAQVETMMEVDAEFATMVEAWEHKLGSLNQMVGLIEPRPEVWDKIRIAVGHSEPQAPLLLTEAQLQPPPVAAAPVIVEPAAIEPRTVVEPSDVIEPSNVIQLSAKLRRWRSVATFTSAIAAALVAMIALGVYQPDLLPERMRPKPRTQVVEVKTPAVTATPSAQYVALLQNGASAPAFILTVDGATKNLTVRKLGAAPEAGKSYELWLISDKLPKPRSLGVIGSGDFTARPVLASYDGDVINNATYAVTVEQAGGSPDGNPHTAPAFTGRLVQTVPAAAAVPAK